jgi:adenylosuccinate lyase
MKREDAYRIVQNAAMEVWQSGKDFRGILSGIPEVTRLLPNGEMDDIFGLEKSMNNVDYVFKRVGLA